MRMAISETAGDACLAGISEMQRLGAGNEPVRAGEERPEHRATCLRSCVVFVYRRQREWFGRPSRSSTCQARLWSSKPLFGQR